MARFAAKQLYFSMRSQGKQFLVIAVDSHPSSMDDLSHPFF